MEEEKEQQLFHKEIAQIAHGPHIHELDGLDLVEAHIISSLPPVLDLTSLHTGLTGH